MFRVPVLAACLALSVSHGTLAGEPAAGSPEAVVQAQLEAYNARDLDAFLGFYRDDATLYGWPATVTQHGKAQMRARYERRFGNKDIRAEVLDRMVFGDFVIDHERITAPPAPGELQAVAIYQVRDGKIASVMFLEPPRPAAAAAERGQAPLEALIRDLDQQHAAAILAGDARALDRLMSDQVTVNHPTNRIVNEKKELLGLIGEGVIRYTRFERRPEKFLAYDRLVVVMGDETVVPARGAPNAGKVLRRRYTNGWMQQPDGNWKLAFRHANNVPE